MSDPLVGWAKEHLTLLFQRDPESLETDFSKILGSTFKADAHLIHNHQLVNLVKFGDDFNSSFFAATRADVEWKEVVAIPTEGTEESAKTGIVVGYFVVTRSLKFRIRAGPAQVMQHCFFSAKVEDDPQAEPEQQSNSRRISELFLTSVNRQAPIHLQSIPRNQQG